LTVPPSRAHEQSSSIPSFSNRFVKPFWRSILFLLPLVVVFGTPALVLWLGGELTSAETVVHRQLADTPLVLHGPAYTNSAIYVKARLTAERRPKVLALGNSRVLEFRREFIRPDVSFYNAGGTVVRIRHYRAFLEKLPPEALPEMLIIATDTAYFDPKFDRPLDGNRQNIAWLQNQIAAHWSASEVFSMNWRDVWRDIRLGKISWSRLFSLDGLSTRVGLNALYEGAGFRNDGSYRYGPLALDITNPRHRDYQFAQTLQQVATGIGRFGWSDVPSAAALDEIDALLDFCAAHHIYVIGFMPPHAHAVWAAMQELGDRYAYVARLEPALRSRFESRGFELYNFSDFAKFGAADADAVDGYHGNERVYLQLFIAMLESGSRLNACANLPELRAALAAAKTTGRIFPASP
jgi:hypothetical protein